MSGSGLDVPLFTKMIHVHMHALNRALGKVLGGGQSVLINSYAEALLELAESAGLDVASFEGLSATLAKMRYAKSCTLTALSGDEVEFRIQGCNVAPFTHKPLEMIGVTGDLCPEAMLAMVALARAKGWKPGEDIFDYVQFTGKMTDFAEDGSKTVFKIVNNNKSR
jgi:hypothetical protein